MGRQSFENFKRVVTQAWPQHQREAGKRHLLATARAGHAQILAAHGGKVDFEAYANRPGNTNLESVVPPGPIVYVYRNAAEIVAAVLEALREASPVVSGAYRDAHTLFVNGAAAAPDAPLPAGAQVYIANPVPYARRIEIGKTESGRDFVLQVPNRIYERMARQLARRFGNQARLTFGYVTLPAAHVISGRLGGHYQAGRGVRRSRRRRAGTAVEAPAIFIEALGG